MILERWVVLVVWDPQDALDPLDPVVPQDLVESLERLALMDRPAPEDHKDLLVRRVSLVA